MFTCESSCVTLHDPCNFAFFSAHESSFQILPLKWIYVFNASPEGFAEFLVHLAKLRGNKPQVLSVTLLALQTQRQVVQLFYDCFLLLVSPWKLVVTAPYQEPLHSACCYLKIYIYRFLLWAMQCLEKKTRFGMEHAIMITINKSEIIKL